MKLTQIIRRYIQRFRRKANYTYFDKESQMIANGWNMYTKEWQPAKFQVLPDHSFKYLGDE